MIAGKRSLFVDTSGWIEVFVKSSPLHNKAREILEGAMRERCQIITTNYIIVEFIGRGGNARHLTRDVLFKAVDEILHLPGIEVVHIGEESHALAITFLRARLDKEWSLVDATSFNVMTQLGISEALTTDHHFEQAKFAKLL